MNNFVASSIWSRVLVAVFAMRCRGIAVGLP
jgi:hypothetical protein